MLVSRLILSLILIQSLFFSNAVFAYEVYELESGRPLNALGICGDALHDEGEECDDGNTVNGDGCNSFCLKEWDASDARFTMAE